MKTKPIMLPTDKSGYLYLDSNILKLREITPMIDNITGCKNQHIYLVSDDEIKKGNTYIDLHLNQIFTKDNPVINNIDWQKKIIASTDKSLNLPYLDLNKDKWMINYYNKNGKLPDEIEVYFDLLSNETLILKPINEQPTERLYTKDEVIQIIRAYNNQREDGLSLNEWTKQNL